MLMTQVLGGDSSILFKSLDETQQKGAHENSGRRLERLALGSGPLATPPSALLSLHRAPVGPHLCLPALRAHRPERHPKVSLVTAWTLG